MAQDDRRTRTVPRLWCPHQSRARRPVLIHTPTRSTTFRQSPESRGTRRPPHTHRATTLVSSPKSCSWIAHGLGKSWHLAQDDRRTRTVPRLWCPHQSRALGYAHGEHDFPSRPETSWHLAPGTRRPHVLSPCHDFGVLTKVVLVDPNSFSPPPGARLSVKARKVVAPGHFMALACPVHETRHIYASRSHGTVRGLTPPNTPSAATALRDHQPAATPLKSVGRDFSATGQGLISMPPRPERRTPAPDLEATPAIRASFSRSGPIVKGGPPGCSNITCAAMFTACEICTLTATTSRSVDCASEPRRKPVTALPNRIIQIAATDILK